MVPIAAASAATIAHTIPDIQGTSSRSPLVGETVAGVVGIVTAVLATRRSGGFWLQAAQGDGDPRTPEGLFVLAGKRTKVQVGDRIRVAGKVVERKIPRRWRNVRTTTSIKLSRFDRLARGAALPEPVRLGVDHELPPGGDDTGASMIRYWEQLEGMRVELGPVSAVAPRSSHGETWVVALGDQRGLRGGDGVLISNARLNNSHRILLAERPLARLPKGASAAALAAVTTKAVTGIATYAYGNFRIALDQLPIWRTTRHGRRESTVLPPIRSALSIATYNVWNLGGRAKDAAFAARAHDIVHALAGPDVLILQEVMDNSGRRDDGIVSADKTYARLNAAISSAGGKSYAVAQVSPPDGADGGVPGGNIRTAVLFNSERLVLARPRARSTGVAASEGATLALGCDGNAVQMRSNPMRLGSGKREFRHSRKPLAALFDVGAEQLLIVGVHLVSKRGDDGISGARQPPRKRSSNRRAAQISWLGSLIARLAPCGSTTHVVLAGDMNESAGSTQFLPLLDAGLIDTAALLAPGDRYTYVYQGNATQLDQIYVSARLGRRGIEADSVHINARYPVSARASDHDPFVVRLLIPR